MLKKGKNYWAKLITINKMHIISHRNRFVGANASNGTIYKLWFVGALHEEDERRTANTHNQGELNFFKNSFYVIVIEVE